MNQGLPLIRYGIVAALLGATAWAQQTNAPVNPPASSMGGNDDTVTLDQVIITATPGSKVTELNAAMDVSVVTQKDIVTTPAAGVAGLLDQVPGFYGQSSGGEVNQNLSVDGLNPSFFTFISLQEDGLPVQYNGFFPEFQIRPDSTYDRVEVVRNGPSTVYSPQAAAATINFISRLPQFDEGDATFSVTSEGNKRADFFYGGPLNGLNGWSAAIGGYFEYGQGERPTGYNVLQGGQIRAIVRKEFSGGSVQVTYKHIDAHVPFYVDTPFLEDSSGHLHPVPGFDARYDTLYSQELENGTLHPPVGEGGSQALDQGNGNSDISDQITVKVEKDLGGGWSIANNARFEHFAWVDDDDRSNGNSSVSTATGFLASSLPTLQSYAGGLPGKPTVTSDELVQVDSGTVIANPGTLNGNGLLIDSANFQYAETHNTVMDDLRTSWKTDRNTLDIGMFYMDDDEVLDRETGNEELIDVRNHARLYDVVGLNASGGVVDHLTDNGVLQYDSISTAYYGNGAEDVSSMNYYVNDQFAITKQLHVDAGFRYEQTNYSTSAENVAYDQPLPMAAANPTVIADQVDGSYGTGTYATGSNGGNDDAWSFGANYMLTDHFSVFARSTKSYDEGVQDFNVFGGQNGNPSRSAFNTLHFDQAGARFENPWLALSATAFFAEYNHYSVPVTPAAGGPAGNIFINYQSKGVDFEGVWRPVHAFQLRVSGIVQKAEDVDIPAGLVASNGVVNGDQPLRMPDVQIRVQPTVYFSIPGATYFAKGSAYILATYYGQRYGDLADTQVFDPYTNWGAGISVNITKSLTFDIIGDNLGNVLAFTEGNPRGGSNLNTSEGLVLARPIFGANAKASLTLHF